MRGQSGGAVMPSELVGRGHQNIEEMQHEDRHYQIPFNTDIAGEIMDARHNRALIAAELVLITAALYCFVGYVQTI
jgi:hypothetical protein